MNDQDRLSNLPTILVAILALFGLATIPQGQGKRPEGPEATAKASVEGAGHKSEVKEPNPLGPLKTLKDSWQNCGPYAKPLGNPSTEREISEDNLPLAGTPNLQFLIVLVPDPDDTSMSHLFDSTLSAVLRATESAGYVAERRWFPWEPSTRDRSKGETKPTHIKGTLDGYRPLNFTVDKEEDSKNEDQPGGVLCRRVSQSKPIENELLMLLLVPETPTWGVDKTRLGQAFKIVDKYRRLQWALWVFRKLQWVFWDSNTALRDVFPRPGPGFLVGNCPRQPEWLCAPIRIVGPNFSGSIPSMAMEMKTWREYHIAPHPRFVIYNGGAQDPQLDVLREDFFLKEQVKFRSTVYKTKTLEEALHKFIFDTSVTSGSGPVRIALLVESNTGFGQTFRHDPHPDPRFQVDCYLFPMSISRLREECTAQGGYRSNEPIQLSAPESLSLQAMTGKAGDGDLMPSFTPSPTAVEGEMILTQMLQEVERSHYPWVRIEATNPHDLLFLAYKVRQVCPDARLCFTTATSLFTHHDIVPYLRGSLVASTYPLNLATQSWTGPAKRPRVGFAYDFSQGIYNATVAHLADLNLLDPHRPLPFLDYSFPHDADPDRTYPPVWISVVGEHGLYPLAVHSVEGKLEADVFYPQAEVTRGPSSDEKQGKSIDGVYIPNSLSDKDPPDPEALRPRLHLSWVVVFLAVSVAGLFGAGWYLWICVALVEGSKTGWPAWLQVSPGLRERLDHPAGRCLATLTAAGGLLLLLLLGLPAWGLASMGYLCPRLDEGWCLPIGGLALAAGILAFLVSLSRLGEAVPPFLIAFTRPEVGRRKYIWWTFALVTLMVVVPGLFVSVTWLLRPTADLRFDCERVTQLSRGITPLVPLLLLGVAGGIALIVGWQRLLLFLRLKASRAPGTVPDMLDPATKAAFEQVRDGLTIQDRLYFPLYDASKAGPWWILAAGVGVLPVVWTGLSAREMSVGFEPRWLQIFFLVAFVLGLSWILLTLVELMRMWRICVRLLHAVAELPMVRAFDRLPTRMVPHAPTRSGDQAVADRSNPLIDRQVEALANSYDRFKTGHEDRGLWRVVPSLGSAPLISNKLTLDKWWPTIDLLLPALAYFWKRRSAVTSYATTTGSGSKPPDDAEEWPGLEDPPKDKTNDHGDDRDHDYYKTVRVCAGATLLRREAAAISATPGVLTSRVDIGSAVMLSRCESEKVPAVELRYWLRGAEDLIALVLARQISWLYSYCKSIVMSLVVGLLALTLALTSYPFQPQEFLLTTMVLLAAAATIVVVIAVQANRDEVLSRINNTTPNQFTFDRQFLLILVTHVVPLLGMLGALSYGMSDVIRSWFEPMFR